MEMYHNKVMVMELKENQMMFWHHMFIFSWELVKRLTHSSFCLESILVLTNFTVSWMCAMLQACIPAPTKRK